MKTRRIHRDEDRRNSKKEKRGEGRAEQRETRAPRVKKSQSTMERYTEERTVTFKIGINGTEKGAEKKRKPKFGTEPRTCRPTTNHQEKSQNVTKRTPRLGTTRKKADPTTRRLWPGAVEPRVYYPGRSKSKKTIATTEIKKPSGPIGKDGGEKVRWERK